MKKLFFFRSSTSNGNNSVLPPSTDKQVYWENPQGSVLNNQAGDKSENYSEGLLSKSRRQTSDCRSGKSSLRRSRSLSSTSFILDGFEQNNFPGSNDQIGSPSGSTNSALHQVNHVSR